MKRQGWWLAMGTAVCMTCSAQQGPTAADAFKEGRDFAKGPAGGNAASGSVNPASGAANVPLYGSNAAEAGIYGGGKSLIGAAGSNKLAGCVGHVASNAYAQQECNAVDYLNRLPTERVRFGIDPVKDPLLVASSPTVANPGTVPASGASACHLETRTTPGTTRTETCEESLALEHLVCTKVLVPRCTPSGCQVEWDDQCAPLRAALKR